MTPEEKIAFVRRAMQAYKSDDLERAQAAFRGMTTELMAGIYGHSGSTRQEILNDYKKQRDQWDEVMSWIDDIAHLNVMLKGVV